MTVVSKHFDEIILLMKEIKTPDFNMSISDLKNKHKDISEHSFKFIEDNIELIKTCNENFLIPTLLSTIVKVQNDDEKSLEILSTLCNILPK